MKSVIIMQKDKVLTDNKKEIVWQKQVIKQM